MHNDQLNILTLMRSGVDINKMKLIEIQEACGIDHPQKVKHHMEQLIKWGYVDIVDGKKVLSNRPDPLKTALLKGKVHAYAEITKAIEDKYGEDNDIDSCIEHLGNGYLNDYVGLVNQDRKVSEFVTQSKEGGE